MSSALCDLPLVGSSPWVTAASAQTFPGRAGWGLAGWGGWWTRPSSPLASRKGPIDPWLLPGEDNEAEMEALGLQRPGGGEAVSATLDQGALTPRPLGTLRMSVACSAVRN